MPDTDVWTIIGASAYYTAEIPVSDASSELPVQQEAFEVLGSNRKVVIRGFVLGHEGSLTAFWTQEEAYDALVLLDYIAENRGPHTLSNPFGETRYVEFGSQSRKWLPGGHLEVVLEWIEVATY